MKIAILHNYMDNLGGAEKLVLLLAKKLKADVFTTNLNKKQIKKFGFSKINIKNIGNTKKKWPFKQIKTILLFKKLRLKNYDAILISGEWALAASKKNQPCVWYIHSLPREIWDFYKENLKKQKNKINKIIFKIISQLFKKFVKKYSNFPKILIANSGNTQRKLITNIKRDSILIYPPVEINKIKFKKSGNFWLSANRIIPHKKIELQIKTFAQLPNQRLKIIGQPGTTKSDQKYFQTLKKMAPQNVHFLGGVSEKKLIKLYANCKAFITTAHDEDFGMTPIEAMAAGKPTVAVRQGGYKETINKKNGLLTEPKVSSLVQAVLQISNSALNYKSSCQKEAKKYSLDSFAKHINKTLKNL